MTAVNWSAAERQAWAPVEHVAADQWVERFGVIPDNGINPEPGQVSLDRTPYFRGILAAAVDPVVEELNILKCTQVGYSTLLRLLSGYWIDQDPGPELVILPDELSAKEWLDEDLVPTIQQTPRLRRYLLPQKKDNKTTAIRLSSMWIFAAWAGSPQRLARRPIRYLIGDEIDKYPPFSGREADPISLALKRISNWGKRAKSIFGSTPTTRLGNIWKRWEGCADKRHYHVPCPHCGQYQQLTWPQVKGFKGPDAAKLGLDQLPKAEQANRIKIDALAYYECIHCRGKIEDRHKYQMLLRGVWASEGQQVAADGSLIGQRPRSTKVGFHLSCLYSPWVSFSTLAAEFVLAEGDEALAMDFRNSRLGEPFEKQIAKTHASTIRAKVFDAQGKPLANAPRPLIVPAWAKLLVATADTQGSSYATGWHPFVIRAWTYGLKSQLVHHGLAANFEELVRDCLDRPYQIEGQAQGVGCCPHVLVIDSGGLRTQEVYEFALTDPSRIKPAKGFEGGRLSVPVRKSTLSKSSGLLLWLIDTEQSKDQLNRLIHDPDPTKWMVNTAIGDSYCDELASEHKIIDPRTKKGQWVKVTSGVRNHAWDCEAMQAAAAWELGAAGADPNPDPVPAPAPVARDRPSHLPPPPQNWIKR